MSGGRKAHATLLQSLCKVDRPKEDLARQPQRTRFCLPPKCGFSSARRTGAMCAVRAFGLLEYMSTCGTQRTRFRPLKRGFSRARRTEPMCTGVHEAPWNAASEVLHLPTRPSRARQGRLRDLSPSAHVPWPKPPRPLQPRCCRRCRRRRAPRRSQRACRR